MELADSVPISIQSALIVLSIMLYIRHIYKAKFSYWRVRGVPSQSPLQSLLRTARLWLGLDSFADTYRNLYLALDGHKYGGTYDLEPRLILRDPELIQLVLTKAFANFQENLPPPDEELDPFAVHICNISGARWRHVRKKVAMAFNSASLKTMFESLKECVDKTDSYLETLVAETGGCEVDAKTLMYHWYTLQVIEHSTFGVKRHFTRDGNAAFRRLVMDMARYDVRRVMFDIVKLLHPKLPALLRWKKVRRDIDALVLSAFRETVTLTKNDAITRNGVVQILLKAQEAEKAGLESQHVDPSKNSDLILTDSLIIGIIANMLLVGGRGMSHRSSILLYELALHPNVQEKLFAEIQEVKRTFAGNIRYENLKQFKYAGQVIEECLRKYPAVSYIYRTCTEPFQVPDTSFVVEKNDKVVISLYGLHRDPQYFPNPEKFDPDRFSDANREKIVPGTYLPYGIGPRNCIASRFATMTLMVLLIELVSKYTFHPTERTPKKLVFDPQIIGIASRDRLWQRFQKRE